MSGPAVDTELPVATPDAAPDAPVAAPADAPAAPEPIVPEPARGPLTRREAKEGLHDAVAARTQPVASPTTTPATLPASVPAPTPIAPSYIEVVIPEGHPFRQMGMTSFKAANQVEERVFRAALNDHIRRNDLQLAQQEKMEAQRRLAERDARDVAMAKWTGRPEYALAVQRYQEIKDSFGELEAQQYWRGVNADFEQLTQQEIKQSNAKLENERRAASAQRWATDAWQRATTMPESIVRLPGFSDWFESALQSFNAEIGLGHYNHLPNGDVDALHSEFFKYFSARLTQRPEVVQVYRSVNQQVEQQRLSAAQRAADDQRRLKEVKEQAVEEYRRSSAGRREISPPHPLGNLATAARDRVPSTTSSGAAEPAAPESVNNLRKSLRNAARDDARRRFGP